MRLLISAEESAGVQAIRKARESGHEIVGILTSTKGGEESRLGATVEGMAARFGYPVWDARRLTDPDFAETIRAESIDVLLNVHSLFVVNDQVLAACRVGAFNLHPGPLPRYAGMNAPNWAILNGEATHGVTLHWMEAGIDTGPIAYQAMFDLAEDDTALTVSRRCSRLGIELIDQLLADLPGEVPKIDQDLTQRNYYGFERPFKGDLPWQSAELFERYVRACHFYPLPTPWGVPTLASPEGELGILKASVTSERCTSPAGTLSFRDGKPFLATEDRWLELKRGLLDTKVVDWGD